MPSWPSPAPRGSRAARSTPRRCAAAALDPPGPHRHPGADRRARPADLRGRPPPPVVGHRRDGRGAQAHVRLADRHRRQRLRLRPRPTSSARRCRSGSTTRCSSARSTSRSTGRCATAPPTRASPRATCSCATTRGSAAACTRTTRSSIQPGVRDGKLFGWTRAVAHQPDLGGVGLGSFSPAARTCSPSRCPPRRSRSSGTASSRTTSPTSGSAAPGCPMLIGLDLRAKVGANTVGARPHARRHRAVRGRHGQGRDEADDVRRRVAAARQAHQLPDGTWHATGYQDQSHSGDRGLHKITVAMTKAGNHLTFDFTGTDPQSGVDQLHLRRHARRGHARRCCPSSPATSRGRRAG